MIIGGACPYCAREFDLILALEQEDERRFYGLLCKLTPHLVRPMMRYLGLFKPAKTRLRASRRLKIGAELLPMIKEARLKRDHQTFVVPPEIWAAAMETLVDTPPATLKLPLKGNGYLLSMIAGQCEQAAAVQEATGIARLRARGDKEKPRTKPSSAVNTEALEKAHQDRLDGYNKALGLST